MKVLRNMLVAATVLAAIFSVGPALAQGNDVQTHHASDADAITGSGASDAVVGGLGSVNSVARHQARH